VVPITDGDVGLAHRARPTCSAVRAPGDKAPRGLVPDLEPVRIVRRQHAGPHTAAVLRSVGAPATIVTIWSQSMDGYGAMARFQRVGTQYIGRFPGRWSLPVTAR
jgi:hypothetical protein